MVVEILLFMTGLYIHTSKRCCSRRISEPIINCYMGYRSFCCPTEKFNSAVWGGFLPKWWTHFLERLKKSPVLWAPKTLWKTLLQKNLHVSKRPKTLDSCFIPIGSCNDHPNKKHGCMMYPHTTQRTFLSLAWNRQPGTSLQLGNRLRRMLRLVWHTRPKVFFSVSYLRVLKKILPRAQKMRPK